MRRTTTFVLGVFAWALLASACQAQPGRGLSPYLNLLRGGNPAINYYGLVRPQVAAAQTFQQIGTNIVALENAVNQPVQTGNRASFMTHSRYFMNNGGGGGVPRTGAAPARGR